jgi:hypothetical protein
MLTCLLKTIKGIIGISATFTSSYINLNNEVEGGIITGSRLEGEKRYCFRIKWPLLPVAGVELEKVSP